MRRERLDQRKWGPLVTVRAVRRSLEAIRKIDCASCPSMPKRQLCSHLKAAMYSWERKERKDNTRFPYPQKVNSKETGSQEGKKFDVTGWK